LTDTFALAVNAPIRVSGDIAGSAGITIIGPAGTIELKQGCVVAKRHVHMTPADAEFLGIKDGEIVRVKTLGIRGLVFDNVVARVRADMALEFHVDIDEANAAGIKNGDKVTIL
jgi:putative phosphotransacetylase